MTTIHAKDVKQMPVDELIPYDRNPNIHSSEQIIQLANSIREWGFTVPILIDEKEVVLAGHGRLFAAKSLNMKTVPCITATGWSDAQKKAYVIADNKLSEGSEWDSSLYFAELKEINNSGFDLSLIGFDESISLDFEPNLQPTTSFTDVNEGDINKAETAMSDNMDRLTGDRSARGTEVMCPYCAETFTFDGI
ncbi:MAG: ParB/Srx family N-terminal domain-containing protein [Paracoccaceae bacterium]